MDASRTYSVLQSMLSLAILAARRQQRGKLALSADTERHCHVDVAAKTWVAQTASWPSEAVMFAEDILGSKMRGKRGRRRLSLYRSVDRIVRVPMMFSQFPKRVAGQHLWSRSTSDNRNRMIAGWFDPIRISGKCTLTLINCKTSAVFRPAVTWLTWSVQRFIDSTVHRFIIHPSSF